MILNSGHDFHMKSRGGDDKVHIEEVDDSPDQMKLFGKYYKKEGESGNMWVGKVTRGDLESDIIIPFLNLREQSIKEGLDIARRNVNTSENLFRYKNNDESIHQVDMKDESFFGLKPIRAKFTDPFYSVDEDSTLNGWINGD